MWFFPYTDNATFYVVRYFAHRDVSKVSPSDSEWMVPGMFVD